MGIPLGKFVLHNPDAAKLHVLRMIAHGKEWGSLACIPSHSCPVTSLWITARILRKLWNCIANITSQFYSYKTSCKKKQLRSRIPQTLNQALPGAAAVGYPNDNAFSLTMPLFIPNSYRLCVYSRQMGKSIAKVRASWILIHHPLSPPLQTRMQSLSPLTNGQTISSTMMNMINKEGIMR